jgi:hypothetical protein
LEFSDIGTGNIPAHGRSQRFQLQPSPGAHAEPAPDARPDGEAKTDTFSITFLLPQRSQMISEIPPILNTSFSNSAPHWEHLNS